MLWMIRTVPFTQQKKQNSEANQLHGELKYTRT
jgi:hypothetical protein